MTNQTTIDTQEILKFSQLANEWWNPDGPLKTLHDINLARMEFMKRYVSFSNQTVLDVGSGGGILSESMASLGAQVTGIDAETKAIQVATLHAKEQELNITYLCQPVETMDAEGFDVVTCMEMLEHVAKPELVIKHCARVLKPGGFLFLSTINRTLAAYGGAILMAEYVLKLLPRQTHDYDKFIKPSELAAWTRKEGLDLIGLSGMGYNPITRESFLQESVQMNYLMACKKS
ncbi:bifunctional 2-polyprenyl-6-hydroxyphenol methylase/3-demethylubiquinol 3-O-methyltransferase UbiG [Legionella impletisoli]|uniref:Ubiquinone biosynthesis O-methyltransferase n=1 Tax=Legionella impletisoli TaxID=343510 RepID=A0A917JNP1_9GAMM|nr:bifunctional 2-polyprenyl-6-hydroxyphenol methylase/3-demethylubiquinol 3-O-methyltransferase UbiG [Legionella impletisoli]GGI75796.1 ubiquinone biosynthesis O-methyltransferase [Legionella impletisoli]